MKFTSSQSKDEASSSRESSHKGAHAVKMVSEGNTIVWVGRVIFLLCLTLTAAALGFASYRLLRESERDLAESQFEAIAERALSTAFKITLRKRLGTVTMATLAANANPDPDDWPYVTIKGYEDISTNLIETSSGREMGLAPLVLPEQLAQFEDFAYDFYFNEREPPFPNGTATSSFGRGVWGVNPALETSDNRYHESDGSTSYGSPNKIFAPILQHNAGPHPALMLNLHFQESRGVAIDQVIACAEQREQSADIDIECGGITDFITLTSQETRPGPGALMMKPIYPANAPLKLTGILASSIVWDEVLTDVFSASATGVDCIITSDPGSHTYRISDGHVAYKGEGDLRDNGSSSSYCRDIELMEDRFFSDDSIRYSLTICPSSDFFDSYSTTNPMVATIGSVCIIVFSALVFLFYDRCVRRVFVIKRDRLEAKRKFVRFVSHEVRTPLNSVCMGLAILQAEMVSFLDRMRTQTRNGQQITAPGDNGVNDVTEWRELIKEVLDGAQSSVDVLNDLLNYDKIEMGTFTLELELVSVWNLVEKTFGEFKLASNKKKINLSLRFRGGDEESPVETAASLPPGVLSTVALGDPFRLVQVIRNLISNAVKFTPEEGRVEVIVNWKSSGALASTKPTTLHNGQEIRAKLAGTLSVEVMDSGAGLSEEQISRLFREGMQFNANMLQSGQGSGLGLFIAKGIAEQHGGSLAVHSTGLDEGTTFTLQLPMYRLPSETIEGFPFTGDGVEETSTPTTSTAVSSKPPVLRVLVVDDSRTNRRFLVRWLRSRGHDCDEACDGVEAVEWVRASLSEEKPYDSILMDYEMPRCNGPKAIQIMRHAGCDSFIVGITGNALPEDTALFRDCGANAVLLKPVAFPDLDNLWSEYGFSGRVGASAPSTA